MRRFSFNYRLLVLMIFLAFESAFANNDGTEKNDNMARPSMAEEVGLRFNTKAKQVILIDAKSGNVLFQKNADELMSPSSMTKIMTAYMIFEKLKNGEVSLDDKFLVSKKAWSKKGTKMFLKLGSSVKLSDLIKGIIVLSGNDACITVAEGFDGDELIFADQMTARAHELGAKSANFVNASGWPDDEHKCSARDLVIIARSLINNFPDEYKKYFKLRKFTYNGISQFNKLNPILSRNFGADGMKTGYTDSGGYGVVVSSVMNGHRLIAVLNGMTSKAQRADEAERVMRWGHRNFVAERLFNDGQIIEYAPVWGGVKPSVGMVLQKELDYVMPRKARGKLLIKAVFDSPVEAPIKKGDKIGELHISIKNKNKNKNSKVAAGVNASTSVDSIEFIDKFPLYAESDVERAGFIKRSWDSLYYLIFGHNPDKLNKKQ